MQAVRQRIDLAARSAGRSPRSVHLVAVTKTFAAEAVRKAVHAGQREFGENYVQEGVEKISEVRALLEKETHS